ncbi:hypothetical protein F3J29_18890 [Enterobacter sp. Cy-643]|uniref:hypothetical protein n=1 Tax=Enterobacter sp. Cy-643 TaxID=2608346 RepID=UPI0014226A1F|nr:hypothetical protein [Enterobacter sp. Cy-643]NIF34195.1 hypothetical protein [Enterobacter sp. Cy-643]
MGVKKISVSDYRDDMGLMRSFSEASEDIQNVKCFYYTEAVKQLKSLGNGIEILKEDENHNLLLFKVNEDLKFQLNLLNKISHLSIDLYIYQKNNRYEDILSEQYHYHCKGSDNYNFSDTEEILEYDRVGHHFRHMLMFLIKEITKITD